MLLHSKIDGSLNNIVETPNGYFESRLVDRGDYICVYLSSHDGCNKACRFCHLTQSGQTSMRQASLDDFILQAKSVIPEGNTKPIHFNFMARGEPLENDLVYYNWGHLEAELSRLGEVCTFHISTIFPKTVKRLPLFSKNTFVYYSYYTHDPKFRKKWLPKAHPVEYAFYRLVEYQQATGQLVTINHSFIENENDSLYEACELVDMVEGYELNMKFNCVRYNPPNDKSRESPAYEALSQYLIRELGNGSRIVPRVGYDVKASCGMFYAAGESS